MKTVIVRGCGFRCHACGGYAEDTRACLRCGTVVCASCDSGDGETNVCQRCLDSERRTKRDFTQALKQYLGV